MTHAFIFTDLGDSIIFFRILVWTNYTLHSQKFSSCYKSIDILQQLVTTSQYQDAFTVLVTAFDDKSVAGCHRLVSSCQNLLVTGLLQVVSTSCNKSANDKLQKA